MPAIAFTPRLLVYAVAPTRAACGGGSSDDTPVVVMPPPPLVLPGDAFTLTASNRPADGQLYALSSLGRVYTLNGATGAATLKFMLTADAGTTLPFSALAGTGIGIDFNPVTDRLRIVSNTGQSRRINVDTGATTTTMSYDINLTSASLALQDPPNDGTLVNLGALGGRWRAMWGSISPVARTGWRLLRCAPRPRVRARCIVLA